MTSFPDAPLDVRAELVLNGAWTDVSAYLDHGPIATGRGHPDESTTVSPSTLDVTLTNNDARFAAKNPTSPYYPYLVRNTPCRVSIPSDQPYLRLEADRSSYASCPAISITTDLDVRADILLTDWSQGNIAGAWQVGGTFGWALTIDAGGWPRLVWSTTGSDFPSARATARLPPGRGVLRATLQLSTGNVTFYTAPGGQVDGSSWTQLGAVVNTTGATSLFAPGVPVTAGSLTSSTGGMYGRFYELEVRGGASIVAHPIFSAQPAGTTSFTDNHANLWTLSGTSELSARDYRLHAEVPEWPQHQDPTGTSWTVAAKGGGLLRRHSQRNNALNSALWRAWVKTGASLAAYHPMEDGPGAQSLASGIGGLAASFSGPLQLASNSDFLCSGALPVLNGTVITGKVPAYAPGWQGNQVSWLLEIPSGGEFNTAEVMRIVTTGTVAQAVVTYGTGGSLALTGYNAAGTQLFASGPVAFAANGQQLLMVISLTPDGAGGVNWALEAATPAGTSFAGFSGNIGSASVAAVTSWTMNGGGQLLQTVAGHVAVQAAPSLWDVTAFGAALAAHAGEAAGNRFQRLCSEEGIQFRAGGDLGNTTLMGVQRQQTLTQLLQECADADRGTWYELRQQLGWGYIPRAALYNQAAAVALAYSADNLSEWASDPVEDDQYLRNDETVTQVTGGGLARQFAAPGQAISGGRLSTLAPPAGCGTYDGQDSLNVWQVGDLPSLASWIVHVGTTDEPRYPGLVIDLSNRALASVFYQVLALELGQRVTVSSPAAQNGPDAISQLAAQLSEEIWYDRLVITMAGVPSRPYLVAQDGATTAHAGTDGSALAQALAAPLEVAIPDLAADGWGAFGAAIASVASPAASAVPQWVKWTSNGTAFGNAQAPAVAASAGVTYTVSGLLYCPVGYTVRCGAACYNGPTHLSDVVTSVTVAAATVTPFSVQVTTPATTTLALPEFQVAAPANGDVVYVTALAIWQGSVLVAVTGPSGVLWTTSAGDFPFDIGTGGERMSVTAIAASAALSLGIADGTFESGVSGWAVFNGTLVQSNSQHHSGSFAAAVTATTSVSSTYIRPVQADWVPVTPGASYTCSLWVDAGQGGCTFLATIDWYDANANYLSSSQGATASPAAFVWTQCTVTGTAPAGAAYARYGPSMAITAINNYYYCDDVTFTVPAQAFTVARGINGVVKAQAAGTSLALWDAPVAAL